MELLENLKNIISKANYFEKSKNYYFENHICKETGKTIKVDLDFKLSNENDDKIMKFGLCNNCKTLFYYYDFESSSF